MSEDGRAIAFDMLVEPDAGAGLGHDRCERRLADFKRITLEIVPVQFDEVEGVEEGVTVMVSVADRSNEAMPLSSHTTASPSMMHDRERKPLSASTISGKRSVRSLPGRL